MKILSSLDLDDRFLIRLLNMQPIAIVLVHRRRLVFATEGLKRILGWDIEEALGKSTRIFFPSEYSWKAFGDRLYGALENSDQISIEWPVLRKDGKIIPCEFHIQAIEKIDDSWLVLSSVRDISQEVKCRRQLQQKNRLYKAKSDRLRHKLYEQKEFFENIVEKLPFGIGVWRKGDFIYKNAHLDEHLNDRLGDVIQKALFLAEEGRFKNGLEEFGGEEVKYIYYTINPLEKGDFVLTTQDVTSAIKLKKDINTIVELKASQALSQERLALMGRMLAEIVHEINTPLTFMKTNLHVFEAMLKGIGKAIDGLSGDAKGIRQVTNMLQECREIASSLDFGIQRIESIVQSVKGISKYDDKDLKQAVDLMAAIKDAIVLVWNRLKKWMRVVVNGVEIGKDFNVPTLNIKIEGNHALIVQLFVILFNNSLDAARERRVKHALARLDISPTGNTVVVAFRDNCGGIEDLKMSMLFQPFSTTREEGSGLGLYILKEIMNTLGGEVEARNVTNPAGFQMVLKFKRAR